MLETRQRLMMVMPLEVIEVGQGIYLDLKREPRHGYSLSYCRGVGKRVRTLWIHRPRLLQEMSVAQVQLTWIYIDVWGSREALRTTTCPFDRGGRKWSKYSRGSATYTHQRLGGHTPNPPSSPERKGGRGGETETKRERERARARARAKAKATQVCEMEIDQNERDRPCLSAKRTPWIPWTVPFSHRVGLMMCIIAAGRPGVCQRFVPEWDGTSQPGHGGGCQWSGRPSEVKRRRLRRQTRYGR